MKANNELRHEQSQGDRIPILANRMKFRVATLGCALLFAGAYSLGASAVQTQSATQTAPMQSQQSSTPKPPNSGARRTVKSKRKKTVEAQVVAEPTRPPDPPPPNWPVNDKAELASVGWNGKDLSINATNSSLAQILHDVSTATGLKVDGFGADQRVYGRYGPADARDVLAELLDGSGYNVMLIGDKGEGTPRQLVLTTKVKGASATPGANAQPSQNGDDDAVEEPEQPEQIPQRPFGLPPQPGQGQRTPQQMMQELQQRQQQQLQNATPPNQSTPPN